ncbi:flagellin, partial [Mediterraneibacter gnavus]|uniref:flagellin N-terminal helical domain-containing protein n=1 Tax=Mediterraneibacter gnavus TaxID=33038 RepID=UPI001D04138D
GAMTEVHSMLNRMVELADQSANGTYADEVDRENLQKEISSLKEEINRIADSTNFNGINLLDGSLSTSKLDISATFAGANNTIQQNAATGAVSTITAAAGTAGDQTLSIEYADADGKLHKVDVKYTGDTNANQNAENIKSAIANNSELSSIFDISGKDANITLTSKVTGEKGAKVTTVSSTDTGKVTNGAVTAGKNATAQTTNLTADIAAGDKITLNGKTYEFVSDANAKVSDGATAVIVGKNNGNTIENLNKALDGTGVSVTDNNKNLIFSSTTNGKGLTLQIGDTADPFNQMTVSVGDMHADALGIADIDISTQAGAKAAVDKIKSAINSVSSTRGDLGAIQNRLEHTINNL